MRGHGLSPPGTGCWSALYQSLSSHGQGSDGRCVTQLRTHASRTYGCASHDYSLPLLYSRSLSGLSVRSVTLHNPLMSVDTWRLFLFGRTHQRVHTYTRTSRSSSVREHASHHHISQSQSIAIIITNRTLSLPALHGCISMKGTRRGIPSNRGSHWLANGLSFPL